MKFVHLQTILSLRHSGKRKFSQNKGFPTVKGFTSSVNVILRWQDCTGSRLLRVQLQQYKGNWSLYVGALSTRYKWHSVYSLSGATVFKNRPKHSENGTNQIYIFSLSFLFTKRYLRHKSQYPIHSVNIRTACTTILTLPTYNPINKLIK